MPYKNAFPRLRSKYNQKDVSAREYRHTEASLSFKLSPEQAAQLEKAQADVDMGHARGGVGFTDWRKLHEPAPKSEGKRVPYDPLTLLMDEIKIEDDEAKLWSVMLCIGGMLALLYSLVAAWRLFSPMFL